MTRSRFFSGCRAVNFPGKVHRSAAGGGRGGEEGGEEEAAGEEHRLVELERTHIFFRSD